MPKNEDLQKHTLNLRAGDMERIRDFFPEIPASNIVRQVISRYVDNIEGQETKAEVEIEL